MHGPTILLIVATAFLTDRTHSDSVGLFIVEAVAAVVSIEPISDDQRLIALPALQYALTIKPRCATDMRVDAISISIADTRRTYSGNEIGQQPLVEVSLTIPGQQIGPIAIQEFCRADQSGTDGRRILHIKDAFTAQLSLRCANDNARTIVYASQPLDVALECVSNSSESAPSAGQDASSATPTR